ncbi:MAG TPA: TetR/AcrR family transcriptional regulator [Clostridia bacterium]|nr:TetR/AcrR family transcriptional regulator [Clostridia bacterium]
MSTAQQRFSSEDRRHQILEVATEIFARQGFEGTTTREIAQGANVNEAIIFRHFPSKEELYWAVIDLKCRTGRSKAQLCEALAEGDDLRSTFVGISERILRRRAEDQTLTRLLLFSALENHSLSHRFFQTYVAEYYEALAEYIRSQIDRGALREMDPLLAARAFLGMVFYHSLIQNLFGGSKVRQYDAREVSETLVSIWLQGMFSKETKAGDGIANTARSHSRTANEERSRELRLVTAKSVCAKTNQGK